MEQTTARPHAHANPHASQGQDGSTGYLPPSFAPGSAFGKYTILEHIGRGGMGDVYKAVQYGLDRPVALKVLPHLLARATEFTDRFNAEALAISRLQHQNIVTLYDYGEVDAQKYIAMQFIQGLTLSRVIAREKPLAYDRIIAIVKQICRGLKYAHASDIVHRDIKSGNIMIEAGDKIFISDFGIAKAIDAPSITTTGMALGTPEFMAPEQCEGGAVDGQSDLYGLGVIMFEMVAGKPPFLADTPLAVAYKQVNEQPPLLSKIRPDIPKRLELIIAKCLKKNKLERYRNADELLRDLDSVGQELAPPIDISHPPTPVNQRITDRRGANRRRDETEEDGNSGGRPRGAIIFLSLLMLGILGLQGYQIWSSQKAPTNLGHLPVTAIAGPASTLAGEGSLPPMAMIDGKPTTVWGISSKGQATVTVDFGKRIFWTHLALDGGVPATGDKSALPPPRLVTVSTEGASPVRATFRQGQGTQVYTINLIGQRFELTFEGPAASAGAIRDWRALGIPYE